MPVCDHGYDSDEDSKPSSCGSRLSKKMRLSSKQPETQSPFEDHICYFCGWEHTTEPCVACALVDSPVITPTKVKPDNWMAPATAKTTAIADPDTFSRTTKKTENL